MRDTCCRLLPESPLGGEEAEGIADSETEQTAAITVLIEHGDIVSLGKTQRARKLATGDHRGLGVTAATGAR